MKIRFNFLFTIVADFFGLVISSWFLKLRFLIILTLEVRWSLVTIGYNSYIEYFLVSATLLLRGCRELFCNVTWWQHFQLSANSVWMWWGCCIRSSCYWSWRFSYYKSKYNTKTLNAITRPPANFQCYQNKIILFFQNLRFFNLDLTDAKKVKKKQDCSS